MKICSKCKKEKPVSEFYRNLTTKSGLANQCKTCLDDANKVFRRTDKGKESVARSQRKHANKNRARHLANDKPNVILGDQILVKMPDEFLDSLKGKYIYVDPRILDELESYLDKVYDMSLDVGELDEVIETYFIHMMHLAESELSG